MKRVVLPLLVVALAAAVGVALRALDADVVGRAIGAGNGAVQVYRSTADRDWVPNNWTPQAMWGGVRFGQVISENGPELSTVRFMGPKVRKQRADEGLDPADVIDMFTLMGDPMTLGGGLVGEAANINVTIPDYDTRVGITFTRQYVDPVVFVQVSHQFGGTAIMAYADDVTPTGATLVLTEAQSADGAHVVEGVHYLVLEKGTWRLDNGAVLEVGAVQQTTRKRGYQYGPSVQLGTPTVGEPIVVTSIQSSSLPGFMETRVRKVSDGTDRFTGFGLRFAHESDGPVGAGDVEYLGQKTSIDYTIGYLSYGTPFDEGPGRVVFRDARGTFGAYDLFARLPGACIPLKGTGFYDVHTGIYGAAPAGQWIQVVAYDNDHCQGAAASVGDMHAGTQVAPIEPSSQIPYRSVRILRGRIARVTERRSWFAEEPILQDEMRTLVIRDGDLKLFRTLPAENLMWEAWSTDFGDITEARFNADGSFSLYTAGGTRRYHTDAGASVAALEFGAACQVRTVKDTGALKDVVDYHCDDWREMPAHALPAMPGVAVLYLDLDRDGHPELVLDLQAPDGSGRLIDDPLGIADLLTTFGFDVPANYWDMLSPTQQAVFLQQVPASLGYGEQIDGAEAQALTTRFDEEGIKRPVPSIGYSSRTQGQHVEGGGSASAEAPAYIMTPEGELVRVPATRVVVTAGDVQYMAEFDQYGPGYVVGATLCQVDYTVGGVMAVSLIGPAAGAAVNLDRNGFTMGVQASVIGVGYTLGNTDGSYVGVSADVGVGFWADAAFGRGGQYGFSLQVPVLPVGVAVYVHKDDAMMVYDFSEGWALEGAYTVADLAPQVWAVSRGWVTNTSGEAVSAMENTWDDTRITVRRTVEGGVNTVTVTVGDTSHAVAHAFLEYVDDVGGALDQVGSTVADGAEVVADTLTNWANGTGDFAEGTVNDAKNFFKKIKFW